MLEHLGNRRLKPLVSAALFLGYEDVLNRPENRRATRVSEQEIQGFLAAVSVSFGPVMSIVPIVTRREK
jgi:hypothetical protein